MIHNKQIMYMYIRNQYSILKKILCIFKILPDIHYMHKLPCTRAHMLKVHEWQMKQYKNASIKPGSQYDVCASVASQAPGLHWNRLDFYSSVASQLSISQRPTNQIIEKFNFRDAIWLVKKILFPWRSRCLRRQCHIVNPALSAIIEGKQTCSKPR